jgi:hypothetical protein
MVSAATDETHLATARSNKMSNDEPLMVDCGPHGERIAAVMCKHMLKSDTAPLGVVENSDDPNDLQAWCYLCEERYEQEGGMTDAFRKFNGMAVVCVACYSDAKLRHCLPEH